VNFVDVNEKFNFGSCVCCADFVLDLDLRAVASFLIWIFATCVVGGGCLSVFPISVSILYFVSRHKVHFCLPFLVHHRPDLLEQRTSQIERAQVLGFTLAHLGFPTGALGRWFQF
jgi:hypothetical protein